MWSGILRAGIYIVPEIYVEIKIRIFTLTQSIQTCKSPNFHPFCIFPFSHFHITYVLNLSVHFLIHLMPYFFQVLTILKFIRNFIDENPLSCCYNEIATIKKDLSDSDELKLKQKTSSLNLKVSQGSYFFRAKIRVPEEYPENSVR